MGAGKRFGDCKCGFPKAAHSIESAAVVPDSTRRVSSMKKAEVPKNAEVPTPTKNWRADAAKATKDPPIVEDPPAVSDPPVTEEKGDLVAMPCSSYRLDLAGKNFGDCKCGFPKTAHQVDGAAATEVSTARSAD